MLVLRHLLTVGVGVAFTLTCGGWAKAQTSPSLQDSQSNPSSPQPASPSSGASLLLQGASAEPAVSDIKKMTEKPSVLVNQQEREQGTGNREQGLGQPQKITPTTAQNTPSPSPSSIIKKDSAPENLNPNANPQFFPTKPQEVDIKTVQPVTLNQAIELALRNNKDLQIARQQLERSRAGLNDALAALYPTLSINTQFDQGRSSSSDLQNQFSEQLLQFTGAALFSTNVRGGAELNYNIYTGERRSATIARAERQVRFQELQVERISEETRFNAADAYYRLQRADAEVAIAQAAVEDTSQTLRDAQLLFQAGLGTRFDVLRGEVDLARAQQQLTQAIATQRTARRTLAQILSVGQQVELTAADEIRPAGTWSLSLDESIVQAYKNRAELEQRLLEKEIGEKNSLIALADIKPTVSFFTRYDFIDNFNDTVGVGQGYILGARMQWTFFDGGSAAARAEQAYRDMDIADTNFAKDRNEIRKNVEEGFFNMTASKENIPVTLLNVQRAEESLRLARLRFQAGVGTQTDVINAQRDATDARNQYLQSIIQYNQSLNTLQRQVSNLPNNKLFQLR
jgi:OMF family outer membrane factor